MVMNDKSKGKICILDYGLVAEVPEEERQNMIAAIIHVGNKNWYAVAEDQRKLGFLPDDYDKDKVVGVMKKILSPYVFSGGGANAFLNNQDYTF